MTVCLYFNYDFRTVLTRYDARLIIYDHRVYINLSTRLEP